VVKEALIQMKYLIILLITLVLCSCGARIQNVSEHHQQFNLNNKYQLKAKSFRDLFARIESVSILAMGDTIRMNSDDNTNWYYDVDDAECQLNGMFYHLFLEYESWIWFSWVKRTVKYPTSDEISPDGHFYDEGVYLLTIDRIPYVEITNITDDDELLIYCDANTSCFEEIKIINKYTRDKAITLIIGEAEDDGVSNSSGKNFYIKDPDRHRLGFNLPKCSEVASKIFLKPGSPQSSGTLSIFSFSPQEGQQLIKRISLRGKYFFW